MLSCNTSKAALLEGAAVARDEESRCPGCHWVLGQCWMLLGTPKKVGREQEPGGRQPRHIPRKGLDVFLNHDPGLAKIIRFPELQ